MLVSLVFNSWLSIHFYIKNICTYSDTSHHGIALFCQWDYYSFLKTDNLFLLDFSKSYYSKIIKICSKTMSNLFLLYIVYFYTLSKICLNFWSLQFLSFWLCMHYHSKTISSLFPLYIEYLYSLNKSCIIS